MSASRRVKGRCGLPEWFVTSTAEAAASLYIPRLDIDAAGGLIGDLGPARRIDVALGLSGRGMALLQYEGERRNRLAGLDVLEYIGLWEGLPALHEAIDECEAGELAMWLENTPATQLMVDRHGRVHRLGQRNGRLHHCIVPAAGRTR